MKTFITLIVLLLLSQANPVSQSYAANLASRLTQCASKDWLEYMRCQQWLIDARRAGNYCVPEPDNGARYQYEFTQFARSNPNAVTNVSDSEAAAEFFITNYACE
ncbi:MAG: hypothetical protein AAF387_01645 [Pseudomonadota bacterium]